VEGKIQKLELRDIRGVEEWGRNGCEGERVVNVIIPNVGRDFFSDALFLWLCSFGGLVGHVMVRLCDCNEILQLRYSYADVTRASALT